MTIEEVVAALLTACPDAQDAWKDHLASFGERKWGSFNDVAVFAHHIVEGYTVGDTHEFEAFFSVLEEMLQANDEEVRALARVGLIEDIQNIASHQTHGYSVFVPWLHERSREAWTAVESAWAGVGSLAEMVRRERGG